MTEHVHLKVGVWCLTLLGFWPVQFKNKFLKFLYTTYFRITFTIYACLVLTQFMEISKIFNKGLEIISDLLGVFLLYALCLVKVWVVGGEKVQRLSRQILITEQNILKSNDKRMIKVYMEYVQEIHVANKTWGLMACSCYILFASAPVFTELADPPTALFDIIDNTTIKYRPRPLPLISWFPFDPYEYYKIAYVCHLISMFLATFYLTACNNFLYGLTSFAVGQIKILQSNLMNIKENAETEREQFLELRRCIIYHKAIIDFVGQLSKAMRVFLLLDFASCALQIAVIGFRVAVMDMSFQLIKLIVYFVTLIAQLFLYYWYGNEIILESVEVARAIWESEWYDFSPRIKLTLLIIMNRAQKPLSLSVGPFYVMSVETMMAILRAGYSYAAVMRRFYRE